MKGRLQEEVRLVEIAQGTRVRYTEMGVFSAVAGNQSSPIQQQMREHVNGKTESYRSLPPAVPLAITSTFSPWTHTSDDSYIYQLSLVLATATVSFDPWFD